MFIIHRHEAFGDCLMAAMFVRILNDHSIDACLNTSHATVQAFADCPLWDGNAFGTHWTWQYEPLPPSGQSFLRRTLDHFAADFELPYLAITRNSVPVIFKEVASIEPVDVVLCSGGGPHTPYRNWPYFRQLKDELHAANIRYIDLFSEQIRDAYCLTQAKRCRLYVGIDTGVSHFISSVVPHGLIVQSGYTLPEQWSDYDYEFIAEPVECRPCWLRSGCPYEHKCMRDIPVARVFHRIQAILANS